MVPGGPSLQLAKISLVFLMSALVKSSNLPEPLFSSVKCVFHMIGVLWVVTELVGLAQRSVLQCK